MSDNVYAVTEIVRLSSTSVEDAINVQSMPHQVAQEPQLV